MASFIYFEEHDDDRGQLRVFDYLPFPVKRVFIISGATVPRGNHAHRACHQVIVALSGSFTVVVDQAERCLETPLAGLWVVPGECVRLEKWSEDAVALVFCSEHYDPKDYIPCKGSADARPVP